MHPPAAADPAHARGQRRPHDGQAAGGDTLSITPPQPSHHLVQLESIGVVGVDHTELIRGITATYYALLPVIIGLGLDREEGASDRRILAEHKLSQVFQGAHQSETMLAEGQASDEKILYSDYSIGVLHLTPEEARTLYDAFWRFVQEHRERREGTVPYEYGVVMYTEEDLK